MKYLLPALVYLCFLTGNTYGQQKSKIPISVAGLAAYNHIIVSYDEARGGTYGTSVYSAFKIEVDDVYHDQLVDSAGNVVKLATPIRAINYLHQLGWELTFYETSHVASDPGKGGNDIIDSYNRVVLIFRQKNR